MPLGALFGSLVIGWLIEVTGRKTAQIISAVPLVGGAALVAAARDYKLLYAGRFISGLGTGMASLSTPVSLTQGTISLTCGNYALKKDIQMKSGVNELF